MKRSGLGPLKLVGLGGRECDEHEGSFRPPADAPDATTCRACQERLAKRGRFIPPRGVNAVGNENSRERRRAKVRA